MPVKTGARDKKYPPDEITRQKFAAQHIKYELDMVTNATMFLARNQALAGKLRQKEERGEPHDFAEAWQRALYNMALESWTVHNRLLLEFLVPIEERNKTEKGARPKPPGPAPDGWRGFSDTAAAEDFVINHEKWAVDLFTHPPSRFKKATNKRIVHLTYERLVPLEEWKAEYVIDTLRVALKFLESVDDSVFPKDLADRYKNALRYFEDGGWTRKPETIPDLEFVRVEPNAPE